MGGAIKTVLSAIVLSVAIVVCGAAEDFDDRWMDGFWARVKGDYTTALRIWKSHAEEGHAHSAWAAGQLRYDGRGVSQDFGEALELFQLAAARDHTTAQYYLGIMYLRGEGVPQDYVEAHKWFNLAAANGHPDAQQARDLLARNQMSPDQIAEAQRLAREWRRTTN